MRTTVRIAGAGPAGLTAAITLARAGIAVEISEARKSVGARFTGGFQIIENTSGAEDALQTLTRFGLSPDDFVIKPIHKAVFFDWRLNPQPVKGNRPVGYLIRRGRGGRQSPDTLDSSLLRQALEAGVEVRYLTRLKPTQADIVATGPAVADGLSKEMVFSTTLSDAVLVLFDTTVSPGGYAYLFVLSGQATLGCAVTREFTKIDHYFNRAVEQFQKITPFSIRDKQTGYSFMNFSLNATPERESHRYVGEAGGFQDYLFGLGLRYATTTGYLSAQSMIHNEPYTKLIGRDALLGVTQEISLVNRYLYEWGGNLGLATMIRQAGRGDLQAYLAGWHKSVHWKRWMLPWIKWRWRASQKCMHGPQIHWCRTRER